MDRMIAWLSGTTFNGWGQIGLGIAEGLLTAALIGVGIWVYRRLRHRHDDGRIVLGLSPATATAATFVSVDRTVIVALLMGLAIAATALAMAIMKTPTWLKLIVLGAGIALVVLLVGFGAWVGGLLGERVRRPAVGDGTPVRALPSGEDAAAEAEPGGRNTPT